ncbi:transposase-like protein [Mesorhizobium sp. USDA 4775]
MTVSAPTYKNHRYPIEIVARAIWLYFRFNLSLRDVEEMLLDRGIVVSYETIRRWCRKHGPDYARRIRPHCKQRDNADGSTRLAMAASSTAIGACSLVPWTRRSKRRADA